MAVTSDWQTGQAGCYMKWYCYCLTGVEVGGGGRADSGCDERPEPEVLGTGLAETEPVVICYPGWAWSVISLPANITSPYLQSAENFLPTAPLHFRTSLTCSS